MHYSYAPVSQCLIKMPHCWFEMLHSVSRRCI